MCYPNQGRLNDDIFIKENHPSSSTDRGVETTTPISLKPKTLFRQLQQRKSITEEPTVLFVSSDIEGLFTNSPVKGILTVTRKLQSKDLFKDLHVLTVRKHNLESLHRYLKLFLPSSRRLCFSFQLNDGRCCWKFINPPPSL